MSWGVFDSGVGGLTVVHALKAHFPELPLTYLGDTARVPYGIRSVETVRRYSREAAAYFRFQRVEGIIVACNTASALALDVFAEDFRGPVLGVVEPGAVAAIRASQRRRIGVIGTPATIRSSVYAARIHALGGDGVEVLAQACPLFVALAEEGWTHGDVPRLVAERYLAPLVEAEVDTVVLACTHYPLLRDVIGAVMGPHVALVDSGEAVAAAVAPLVAERPRDLAAGPAHAVADHFCVTDAGGAFRDVAIRFLGGRIDRLETVDLSDPRSWENAAGT